jgi:hypothetical protein
LYCSKLIKVLKLLLPKVLGFGHELKIKDRSH